MRTKKTVRMVLIVLLMLPVLATALPAQAGEGHSPTNLPESVVSQGANPADKVRALLTDQGYKVLKVGTNSDGDLAGVYMDMASYQFDESARRQAVAGWHALSQAYTDPAIKVYLSGLVYQQRYLLCFFVAPADFDDWLGGRINDQTFTSRYVFRVMDLQTEQWVTDKDFLHKNFGFPEGKGAAGPMPKPAEGGDKLAFEDDFSDPDSGWSTGKGDVFSVGYADGEYFIRQEEEDYVITSTYPDRLFDDFTFQAECRLKRGDPESGFGLIFRYAEVGDDDEYYLFAISGDGYYNLALRQDGEWHDVGWIESQAVKRGSQVNVLKVACTGDTISLYVNDEHVKTVQDDSLSKGEIGLFVSGYGTMPAEARFDNVKVWTTTAPGPSPTPKAGPVSTPRPTQPPPALSQTLCCGTSAGGTKVWSVRYPAGWKVLHIPDNPQNFTGVVIYNPENTIRIGLVPSSFTPAGDPMDTDDVDEFLDAYRARRERENPGFQEILRQSVSGLPEGRVWAGTWGTGNDQMWASYLTILYPIQPWVAPLPRGYLIMLGLEATGPEWGRAVATYEAMLQTVQTREIKSGSDAWTGTEIGGTAVKPMMIRWCPNADTCCTWRSVTADRENWACPVCDTPTEAWETVCR